MEKPKVLIELYVASPPTFKCKRMMEIAEEIAKEYPGRVKINIYYRGQPIPEEATTGFRASLKSMGVPSIFIDGRWVASTNPPPIDRVRKYVEEDLKAIEEYMKKHGS